jgi:ferric-dicitrate binding protein FerR (iron transport regulator)
LLSGLLPQINTNKSKNTGKVVPMASGRNKWWRVAAAAAAVVFAISIYVLSPPVQYNNNGELAAVNVPANELKHITLADGSIIRVNEGSKLQYPTSFNGNTREVYLSGEAYFDVAHDPSKPFIIHTGKVITTVLGTAFNIKADEKSQTVIVTVTRGKVRVSDGEKPVAILTPDQQVRFNLLNNEVTKSHVDALSIIAWQNRDLRFDNTTLVEAASILKQQFNVDISFANDKLKDCRFTGSARAGEDLESILKAICAFNNAVYRKTPNGNIIIEGPGCE